MEKEEVIKEIINGICDFKIIPFFGAGMSKPCKALDWAEVIAELKNEFNTQTQNYLAVAQEYEEKFGRGQLISRLQQLCQLKIVSSESLENHMKILGMNPPVVYTTNYDNALEEAANQLLKDYKTIVGLKDIVDSKHGEKQIIKFHGDFSNENSIVFTRNDYDKRLKADENPLDILFRSHILGKSILFLGYGFGDENIDYIFKKHAELYGESNLLKSYIISFQKNDIKEKELREKNIITLVLNSVSELSSLIDRLSSQVFSKTYSSQFESMFKPLPSILLSKFDFENLTQYIESNDYSNDEKYDKIRRTLEIRTIPQEIEKPLVELFEKVINGDYDLKVKEGFLIAFQHTNFRQTQHVFQLCLEFMKLTEHREFNSNFGDDSWGSDVLMIIEHKLGDTLEDSVQCRKWCSIIILGYLEGMKTEGKKLSFDHVDRLLEGLKSQRYEDFGDLDVGFDRQNIDRIINHYLAEHGSTLRNRFNSKSIFSSGANTMLEIKNQMMKSFPKNLDS
jgi:hypothetical protein